MKSSTWNEEKIRRVEELTPQIGAQQAVTEVTGLKYMSSYYKFKADMNKKKKKVMASPKPFKRVQQTRFVELPEVVSSTPAKANMVIICDITQLDKVWGSL